MWFLLLQFHCEGLRGNDLQNGRRKFGVGSGIPPCRSLARTTRAGQPGAVAGREALGWMGQSRLVETVRQAGVDVEGEPKTECQGFCDPGCPNARHPGQPALVGELALLPPAPGPPATLNVVRKGHRDRGHLPVGLKFVLASYRYPRCPKARHPGQPSFAAELTFLPRHLGQPPSAIFSSRCFPEISPSI